MASQRELKNFLHTVFYEAKNREEAYNLPNPNVLKSFCKALNTILKWTEVEKCSKIEEPLIVIWLFQYDHVDEITVDDIFALMIDAMEKDTDVKIYDADISSDPYLGKNWSGGLFVDHHFPDFEPLIDE